MVLTFQVPNLYTLSLFFVSDGIFISSVGCQVKSKTGIPNAKAQVVAIFDHSDEET